MTQGLMYQGYVNSPYTILSAGITDVATSIAVLELGVFPAANNIAVLGSGSDAETVLITAKSAATGAGTLTVTREWNKTGTYGAKKAWLAGTVISRRFTEYDHATFKANIEDHETRVAALETLDALVYKGVIACAGNPNYPAANAGYVYKVSTAGKIGGASGKVVEIGDVAICYVDSSATGDEAAVGANWDVIQENLNGAVVGPASATADAIALFNSTTGKIIKDSAKTIVTTLGADDTTVPTSKAVKDVTDNLVTKALFDAQTIIAAVSDNTPAAVTIGENDIVGRLPSGDIAGVTLADLTEESTPAAGDFLLGWESGGAIRKFDIGDLPGGGDVATDAIWDAAGDMVVGTGANTAGKVGKGTADQVWQMATDGSIPGWRDPGVGSGDVIGPAASTDNTIARFNGTDNKTIDDSLVTIDDNGSINIPSGQTYSIDGTPVGSGAIATDAIWDAAGDMVVGTGANTAAKLSKGTTLQILHMKSDASTVEWVSQLLLAAGSASAGTAPIKFTAGILNTNPEAGAIEFDGSDFYISV